MNRLRATAAALVLVPAVAAAQTFHKWVDEHGVTHYSAGAPPGRATSSVTIDPDAVTSFAPAPKIEPLPSATPRKSVVMYSAAWCGVCKQARRYFQEHKVPFTEYDIDTTEKGRADFRQMGGGGVPLILVGQERMRGFSRSRFEQMLK